MNISEYILARVCSLIQNKINTNIGVRILISVHLFWAIGQKVLIKIAIHIDNSMSVAI